jgi:hypothetical protein
MPPVPPVALVSLEPPPPFAGAPPLPLEVACDDADAAESSLRPSRFEVRRQLAVEPAAITRATRTDRAKKASTLQS